MPSGPEPTAALRLSDGPFTYDRRLAVLWEVLAPTVDRGGWRTEGGDFGQDHFATVDTDWLLTRDMSRPHQIRITSHRIRRRTGRLLGYARSPPSPGCGAR
jgi:hypothetical protein